MLATVTEDGEAKVGATADGIAATVAAGICNSTNAAAGGSPLMGQAQVDVDRFGRRASAWHRHVFVTRLVGLPFRAR